MNTNVLSAIEFDSIALGMKALDEMVKSAPITILDAITMCPGKFIVIFSGDLASVEHSYNKGLEIGDGHIIDKLFLPYVHPDVLSALGKVVETEMWDALGIIETLSVVSSIEAADIAAKTAGVTLIEIRLSIGYGGKSYVKMLGTLDEVSTSMQASVSFVKSKNVLCMESIIAQPHREIRNIVMNIGTHQLN